jgi:hypothetical protein
MMAAVTQSVREAFAVVTVPAVVARLIIKLEILLVRRAGKTPHLLTRAHPPTPSAAPTASEKGKEKTVVVVWFPMPLAPLRRVPSVAFASGARHALRSLHYGHTAFVSLATRRINIRLVGGDRFPFSPRTYFEASFSSGGFSPS